MININGIAHIQLNVSNFALSKPFYEQLCGFIGMQVIYLTDDTLYCVGGRTGIAITQAPSNNKTDRFDQKHIGLHHFCFRLREHGDVDKLHNFVKTLDATIIRPPSLGKWAKGYYSLLFEDPDGMRIEACYVPGKGNLDEKVKLPLAISLV